MLQKQGLFILLLLVGIYPARASDNDTIEFSIPAQRADSALTIFARQAGLSVLFPYEQVSRVRANALEGAYSPAAGLEKLLKGTGLSAGIQGGNRLTVRVQSLQSSTQISAETAVVDQDAATDAATKELLEEITVTGSRIGREGFNSAQPGILLDAGMFNDLLVLNTGDAMSLLPVNLGNWTPTAKPGGNESPPFNVFNGLYLANLRGLNPAYGTRTLTLVDSKRHMPTNQGDGVDLNMIPRILIKRMEVVTGGASASYGSGAIGGVVNILMDNELDGARSEFSVGATQRGDGKERYLGFAWGSDIGEAGHLTLGIEAQDSGPVENCIETRSWCARGAYIVESRQYRNNGGPHYVYRENTRFEMSQSGVFPALGLEFEADGVHLRPYVTGDTFHVGGDGQHAYLDTTLRTDVDRTVAYFNYEHRFDADFRLYFTSAAGSVSSWTPQDSIDLYGIPLLADNYYLNQLPENPCASDPQHCFISKDLSAQVATVNDTKTELYRLILGGSGRFGNSSWTWDTHYQVGQSHMTQAVLNSRHALRMAFAIDAVDDGTGNPVCRVTRDGVPESFGGDPRLADGCVPLNIFGTGRIPDAASAYAWGQILEDTRVEQEMLEMVASGDIGKGFGAGPVKAALGLSWRRESLRNLADGRQPDYLRTDYNSQFGESFGGDVAVTEYFTEILLPITQEIDLQLAARRSHYQNTGGIGTGPAGESFRYDINTWKINGRWQPSDWLTVQASRSRDLRAPNFRELYYGKVFPRGSNFGYCDNPWTGNRFEGWYTFTGDSCRAELRGGVDLKPERADTTTFGIAVTAPQRNARLAVDYYRIKISDAITPASWFYTTDRCYLQQEPEFCNLIEGVLIDPDDPFSGYSRIDAVSSKALNQLYYETSGIDITADWIQRFAGGEISMRLLASRMLKQLVQPDTASAALLDIAGVTGSPGEGADWEPAPDWSIQWFGSFKRDGASMTLHARYVSEGVKSAERIGPGEPEYDPGQAGSIDDNHVPDYLVWDLTGSYEFDVSGKKANVFAGIQNLFDAAPPLIGSGVGGTNPVLFDTIGRRYRLGLRFEF